MDRKNLASFPKEMSACRGPGSQHKRVGGNKKKKINKKLQPPKFHDTHREGCPVDENSPIFMIMPSVYIYKP